MNVNLEYYRIFIMWLGMEILRKQPVPWGTASPILPGQ